MTTTLAPVRRLAMLAVLLAFAFQAFAVQTHLHGQPASAKSVQMAQGDAPAKPLPTDPLDPATCKLCQELIHSGAAVTPAGPEIALLLDWAAAALPPAWLPSTALLPQTGWQSRAPPNR
jgi:hypothetical protein